MPPTPPAAPLRPASPPALEQPPPRLGALALLLLATCGGTAAAVLLGRQLLLLRPTLNPNTPAAVLNRTWRWDLDPQRRRDAALLLLEGRDAGARRRLLRNQGWGRDPEAALVLKQDALAAEQLGDPAATGLWQQLLLRFNDDPTSADALYALGRQQPALRRRLLQRFPAHPAALAAAVEQGGAGALHLARWGARWPGAEALLRQRCSSGQPPLSAAERDQLAGALGRVGASDTGRLCLGSQAASPDTTLALNRPLLRDPSREAAAEAALLQLAQQHPHSNAALEAVRLLSEGRSTASLQALAALPATLQEQAPVQARRLLARAEQPATAATPLQSLRSPALALFARWPDDPASWELQWRLARQAALTGQWSLAEQLLNASALEGRLPVALEARRRFWLGLSAWLQGNTEGARRHWRALQQQLPGGYYGWRAASRLGDPAAMAIGAGIKTRSNPSGAPPAGHVDREGGGSLPANRWEPLHSGDPTLDQLWRLGQPLEAWERWRLQRGAAAPDTARELLVEGRLRRAVGDHWLGLEQLERAALRLPAGACRTAERLERAQRQLAFRHELELAAAPTGVPAALLAAVARQESRFSATVQSPAGAVGLLQLLPSTASDLAGAAITAEQLQQPERNALLGARYLQQLLTRWQGDPLLAVASYNAGPAAVEPWVSPQLQQIPELWVEAIPYPETRLYVKKVLGNLWSLQAPAAACD